MVNAVDLPNQHNPAPENLRKEQLMIYLLAHLRARPGTHPELMQAANSIGSETYRFLEPYTLVGLIFLALSLPTAGLVRLGERRLRRKLGL